MSKNQHLYDIIHKYHDIVMALEDPTVTMLAKNVAFYAAMIDACEADPLGDSDDQAEIYGYLERKLIDGVEEYQRHVNRLI